jgi:hypothetical protein
VTEWSCCNDPSVMIIYTVSSLMLHLSILITCNNED